VDDLLIFLLVGLGVERCLGEQNRVFLGGNMQLVVEHLMSDLFDVVPVGDDAVLDGVLQGQDTAFSLCFVADLYQLV